MLRGDIPYRHLGDELQRIRTAMRESTAEVSGAVEIDAERLDQFERGETRPSEDILLLLIAHFGIKEDKAARLWQLAGYNDSKNELPNLDDGLYHQQAITILPLDSRVVYTDSLNVAANNQGVVLSFMQAGINNQPLTVGRVGMSIEHARSVLEVLRKTIDEASKPKTLRSLPAPKPKRSSADK